MGLLLRWPKLTSLYTPHLTGLAFSNSLTTISTTLLPRSRIPDDVVTTNWSSVQMVWLVRVQPCTNRFAPQEKSSVPVRGFGWFSRDPTCTFRRFCSCVTSRRWTLRSQLSTSAVISWTSPASSWVRTLFGCFQFFHCFFLLWLQGNLVCDFCTSFGLLELHHCLYHIWCIRTHNNRPSRAPKNREDIVPSVVSDPVVLCVEETPSLSSTSLQHTQIFFSKKRKFHFNLKVFTGLFVHHNWKRDIFPLFFYSPVIKTTLFMPVLNQNFIHSRYSGSEPQRKFHLLFFF